MSSKKRLLWIELIRIVSMLMILTLHICNQGGVLDNLKAGSASYYSAWLIESFCYCAVNCYAIITGFVMYEPSKSNFKYSGIIPLWLQVFYYSAAITLLFAVFIPEKLSYVEIIKGFTPLISNQYWYFTAYFGMFFFIPFFNMLIDRLDKHQFLTLLSTLFVVFSFLPYTFSPGSDLFNTNSGYSTLWLAVLYFAGAFIKRFGLLFELKRRTYALLFVLFSVIPCISPFVYVASNMKNPDIINELEQVIYSYDYTSPFTVISAISLFMFFKDIDIKSRILSCIIKLMSSVSFGVYLIHVHPLVFSYIVKDRLIFLTEQNCFLMVIGIITISMAAYIILAVVEYLRILLFRSVKVRERSEILLSGIILKIKNMKIK